jgi:hypothetical protein
LLLLSSTFVLAQTDSTIGTWRLNMAKSKYQPGPALVSETRVYELHPALASRPRSPASKQVGWSGPSPTPGSPDADMISLKRIHANTVQATQTKAGRVTLTTRAIVSADGKTRMLTTTGMNAQGQKINNLMVFERQ